MRCKCGNQTAGLNFKDELVSAEVLGGLYCPACSGEVKYNPETMLIDNGWIIEYDMDVARCRPEAGPQGGNPLAAVR